MDKARKEVKDGEDFPVMPFEGHDNGMRGRYEYAELEKRLRKIRELIDLETDSWITKGLTAFETHNRVSANLILQFDQCVQHFATNPGGVTITLEREKNNPFVWTMVLTLVVRAHCG